MPCNTRRRYRLPASVPVSDTVTEAPGMKDGLLKAALEALGFAVEYKHLSSAQPNKLFLSAVKRDHAISYDGKMLRERVTGREEQPLGINAIRQAYAREAIQVAAKRNGWTLNKTGAMTFQVQRRAI